jgi:hypothetical protein
MHKSSKIPSFYCSSAVGRSVGRSVVRWVVVSSELKKRTALEAENEVMDEIQAELESVEYAKAEAQEKEAARLSRLGGLLRSALGLDYFLAFLVPPPTSIHTIYSSHPSIDLSFYFLSLLLSACKCSCSWL